MASNAIRVRRHLAHFEQLWALSVEPEYNPHTLRYYQSRLTKLQRELSKKKKKSNNYNKLKRKIAICYEKITNIRKDYLHKISKKLVNENQVIITEDLHVKNMIKNHKLAYSIADASLCNANALYNDAL